MRKGKVICVYSPKGGVGKSVISSNLAGTGSIMNHKTLLIDFDIYSGCLSLYINREVNKTVFNLCDDIKYKRYTMLEDYTEKYNDNLDILCAPKMEIESPFIKINYLNQIIYEARNKYDLIIIDTNSIFNEFNEELFRLSDKVLLIINNDINCIVKAREIINIFKAESVSYKILYNEAFNFKDEYFTHYDLVSKINSNIDFSLKKESFIKNITEYIMNHYIPVLYKDNDIKYYKFVDKLMMIIDSII